MNTATRPHRPGRPGGGWDSDEDDQESSKGPFQSPTTPGTPPVKENETDKFLHHALSEHPTWPIDILIFRKDCLNLLTKTNILEDVCQCLESVLEQVKSPPEPSILEIPVGKYRIGQHEYKLLICLLLVEVIVNESLFSIDELITCRLVGILLKASEFVELSSVTKIKCKKNYLIINSLKYS